MVLLILIASMFVSVMLSMDLKGSAEVMAWVADVGNVDIHRNAIRLFAGSHCTSASDPAVQPRLFALLFRVEPAAKNFDRFEFVTVRAAVAKG